MNSKKLYLIVAIAILLLAIFFRYEIVVGHGGGVNIIAYRMDRWTGEIVYLGNMNGEKVQIK